MNKEVKDIKNKEGEIKSKIIDITNKKAREGLEFDTINDLYKKMVKKYGAGNINITGMHMDGGLGKLRANEKDMKNIAQTTLKAWNYLGDDLKHADASYWDDQPQEIRDMFFDKYYSVRITIRM
jgi:hypothetical protein